MTELTVAKMGPKMQTNKHAIIKILWSKTTTNNDETPQKPLDQEHMMYNSSLIHKSSLTWPLELFGVINTSGLFQSEGNGVYSMTHGANFTH